MFKSIAIKYYILYLFVLFGMPVSAQVHQTRLIDTLFQRLGTVKADTDKAALLLKIGRAYAAEKNPDSADYYLQRSLLLSKQISWSKGIANYYYYSGSFYRDEKNYVAATASFKKGEELSAAINDYRLNAKCIDGVGYAMTQDNKSKEIAGYLTRIVARLIKQTD